MLDVSFILTPAGLTWLVLIIGIVLLQLVMTGRAMSETSRVQRALMVAAKRRALKTVTVVIELSRRADTVFDLLDHLTAHHYSKLDVVVIIRHTAGKHAERDLMAFKKTSGLRRLTLVRYRKGMTVESIAASQAKGTVLLKLDPDMRLNDRFFTYLSYAFSAPVDALYVRRFRRPQRTLLSAWWSLSSLWRAVFASLGARRPQVFEGELVAGVPVLKQVIKKQLPYTTDRLLFDDFGLDMTNAAHRSLWLSWQGRLVVLALLAFFGALLGYLVTVTPRGMLSLMAWSLIALYVLSSWVQLSHFKGLGRLEQFLVLLLIPFYPFYLVYHAVRSLLDFDKKPRSKAPRPTIRPVQPATR